MIKVYISGNRADVIEREPLTSGTVGKVINFAFTEDWRPLIKYAVFEGSGRRKTRDNIGDSCIIPHEVLAKHGGALRVGVYGRTADGSAATPTVYAQLGIILRGADPNADPSTKPTLPVWAQLQAQIGDLANLTTEDKTNLVAAINEAAKSGGSGSVGKDGTGIASITYKGEDEDGGNVYTVLLTDGTSYDITAPKGAKGDKGDKGDTGATGPQGPAGATGKDGASMGITGATVGQIAKITAVDDSGKPTAWSPVDMPTGGGGETWELIKAITIADDAEESNALTIDMDESGNSFSLKKAKIFGVFPAYKGESTRPKFSYFMLNGVSGGGTPPYCYTSGWEAVADNITKSCSIEVDLTMSGLQNETVWRSNKTSGEYFGPARIEAITSIGGIGMLIYPGCRFWLYGMRS